MSTSAVESPIYSLQGWGSGRRGLQLLHSPAHGLLKMAGTSYNIEVINKKGGEGKRERRKSNFHGASVDLLCDAPAS